MPNKQGGKNYKKSKHTDDEPLVYEVLSGQMYGRIIKLLGGCNTLVFCNDGKERICHIRGNMRRKVWIDVGDIVLISLRELDSSQQSEDVNRGDICAKYDSRVVQRLQQKDSTINPRLFTTIEKAVGTRSKQGPIPDDEGKDGFVFEATENDSTDDTSSSDSENNTVHNRTQQRKQMLEDDIDIDNI